MNEREFELINIIGQEIGANQRDISRMMDMSLGMVNMLIRRLISKGYIRIEQLNQRKVQYLLTPKGFSEKMSKSIRYTVKTINSISLIKNQLIDLFRDLYAKGHRNFYVYSEPDLMMVINKAFHELPMKDAQIFKVDVIPQENIDGILLLGKEDVLTSQLGNFEYVDLIHEISKETISNEV